LLQKRDAAQKVLQAATQKVHVATEELKRQSTDLLAKIKAATDLEKDADKAATEVGPNADRAQLGSSAARLSLLMADLTKIIGDSSEAKLKNDQALFKEMQAQRQKDMEKAAADYDAEVAKAEKINKTMGCIGKIVGYILTAVSVIALPFTGGASMALAVIGIGLAAADAITSAVTGGKSLTDMAMAPIMSGVIQPLIELISKVVTAALVAVGVPKEKAKLAGSIIAAIYVAIATIVLMVAVSTLAKSPAAGRALAKMAKTSIGKAIKAVVKPIGKALAKPSKKFDKAQIEKISRTAEYANAGISAANSGVQGGGGIAQGVFLKRAADSEADLVISKSVMKQIERMLSNGMEYFDDMKKTGQQLTTMSSDAMQREMQSAGFAASRLSLRRG
jgi:invasin B